MRILFLSPTLGIGGSERLTVGYAEALRDRGHAVAVAHGVDRHLPNDLAPELTALGIPVFRVCDRPLDHLSVGRWARGLHQAIERFSPDVLHAQSVTAAVAGRVAGGRLGQVVTVHGLERADRERLAALVLPLTRSRLTAVSQQAATGLSRHWPHPPVEVLPAGIDIAALRRAADRHPVERFGEPAFCCVARQEWIKGVDVLIRAFAEVLDELPDAGLTLVGPGSELERNTQLAASLEIDSRTRFTGAVPTAAPYLVASDLAVLPSRREGLPVAALEALGLGVAVVASDVGGTSAVVRPGETGWLVPAESPTDLARALREAGSDLEEAGRRGQAGIALLKRDFAPEPTIDRLESVLAAAAGSDAGSALSAAVPALKPAAYYVATRAYQRSRLIGAKLRADATAENGQHPSRPGVRVFGYHRVTDKHDVLSVTTRQFQEHMKILAASGITVLRLDDALDRLEARLDEPIACVTFDDGFYDLMDHAAPMLAELGIPATVYLPTAMMDGSASYSWYRRPPKALSWEDVAVLDSVGVFDFQSHSRTHPALPLLDDARAADEIAGSKAELEHHLGRPASSFSYPAGLYSPREVQLVKQAGYRAAVTTRAGQNNSQTPTGELRRTMIGWHDSGPVFAAKLAGLLDRPSRLTEWAQRRRSSTLGRRRRSSTGSAKRSAAVR